MAAWIWVLIPLTAILMGGFKEWLKFKSKQDKLGTSTHELEGTVRELREALEHSEGEREKLTRRLENLEAIVTSEAWDALHEDALHETERLPSLSSPLLDGEEREAPRKRAERMARRLGS